MIIISACTNISVNVPVLPLRQTLRHLKQSKMCRRPQLASFQQMPTCPIALTDSKLIIK